jgi:spermidine synthase
LLAVSARDAAASDDETDGRGLPPEEMEVRRRQVSVAVLVFGSGLCALVYQVTWLRELRLIFGASTPASAAVLAVFMGGLGFGGLLFGRRVERSAEPLAYYGRLEIGAALLAGLSPLLLVAVRHLYLATGGSGTLGSTGSTVVRLALTALVLGVPTLLMGGTLPAIGRAVTAGDDRGRRSLGWMYGVNALGAVTGAALTTFLLLEALGQRKSLIIAALVNSLIGLAALSLARRWGGVSVPSSDAAATAVAASSSDAATRHAAAPLPLVLAGAALVGFAYFLMELVWYRLMAPLLGGTTYTFGIILLLALAGIGGGGLLYGASARRQPSLAGFAATCALEALLLIVPLALSYRLALLAAALRSFSGLGFGGTVLGWLVVAGIVVLPASLVAGYQFPLLVGLLGTGRREVARQTGFVYACNTAGAIVGSLAGGFGLLPLLGAPGAWRLATLLLAVLAVIAALAARRPGGGRLRSLGAVATAAGAALACLWPGPGAFWRYGEIGAGRPASVGSPNELLARVRHDERSVVWEEEGRESAVALQGVNGLAFIVNGKVDGNARGDAETQVMLGLVASMLHGAPRRVLVIGLGTGSSAGWLAAAPGVEGVDVVELEPAVVRVARDCAAVNLGVLDNPRVKVHIGDAREFLLTADEEWDLIVSEPSNPYRAGIASLFTSEYYRAAAERLAPGGLFAQWLQAYQVDASTVASVYTSLSQAFPYVETWATNDADLVLVAAPVPWRHDVARTERLAGGHPYREALAATWGVEGSEGFYAGFVGGPGLARRLAASGEPPNVDDLPVIEFGFARTLGAGSFSIDELRSGLLPPERRPSQLAGLDWRRIDQLRAVRSLAHGTKGPPPAAGAAAQARWLGRVSGGEGATPVSRPSLIGLLLSGEQLADKGDDRVRIVAASLLPERPVEAAVLLARWHLRQGRQEQAVAALEQGLIAYRRDPWPWPALMERALSLAVEMGKEPPAARRLLAALSQPFAVRMFELDRQLKRVTLAARAGGSSCRSVFHDLEPYPMWSETVLRQRALCYARLGDPLAERAAADLGRFRRQRPPRLAEVVAGTGTSPPPTGAAR